MHRCTAFKHRSNRGMHASHRPARSANAYAPAPRLRTRRPPLTSVVACCRCGCARQRLCLLPSRACLSRPCDLIATLLRARAPDSRQRRGWRIRARRTTGSGASACRSLCSTTLHARSPSHAATSRSLRNLHTLRCFLPRAGFHVWFWLTSWGALLQPLQRRGEAALATYGFAAAASATNI